MSSGRIETAARGGDLFELLALKRARENVARRARERPYRVKWARAGYEAPLARYFPTELEARTFFHELRADRRFHLAMAWFQEQDSTGAWETVSRTRYRHVTERTKQWQ